MTSQTKNDIHKPIQKLSLSAKVTTPEDLELNTATQALKDLKWFQAMSEEFDALIRNGTWD